MAYDDSLSAIVDAVIDGDDDAFNAAYSALPLTPGRAAPRGVMSEQQKKRIYERDHYQCRYCGRKLILSDVLVLLLGFAGAHRRGELVALTLADVTLHPTDGLHVRLRSRSTWNRGIPL